ncbi:MAG: M48 family metalloprotease [Gammaproteobacteria bacterium]|nr:M48 family metalloprotease [Gammaproteobacteria bacterium]MDH3467672.1 M48 family metalloprotease [Gammaproteobacteria bacterium]
MIGSNRLGQVPIGLVAILMTLFIGACAAPGAVEPLATSRDVTQISDKEARLWNEANDLDEAIRKADSIYENDELEDYLQQVIDRLYPEFKGAVRIRVLKSPVLNAFALPNGSIYINVGLLARLDNEAQLATVLAHETAHFVDKHSLRQRRQVKSASAIATGVAMAGSAVSTVAAGLIGISSMYGYSRELERDADRLGYDRLQTVGYDVAESVRVFEHLAAEAKALDEKQPVFFSSHPSLNARINSFNSLIQASDTRPGRVGEAELLQHSAQARIATLRADASMHRYKSLLLALEADAATSRYPARYRYYYLGEGYRLRDEAEDNAHAETAYRNAIKADPNFAPPYRALGLQLLKHGDTTEVRRLLKKYLDLAPQASDREYVTYFLHQLDTGGE